MEVKRETAKSLISRLSSVSEQTRIAALCELRLLTRTDSDIRPLIAEEGGIPYIAENLYSPSPISQENAAAALHNISISARDAVISTRGVLDALSHALRNPATTSPEAVQSSAATLYSLLVDEKNRPLIGSKRDILYALIEIVKNRDSPARSVKDSLKALFGISLCSGNRAAVIDLGGVGPLFARVVNDRRAGILEDATAVIAQLAGCVEAGPAFHSVSGVDLLVDLIDPDTGSNERVKEKVVSALMNLVQFCCDGGKNGMIKDAIARNGRRISEGIGEVVVCGSPKGKSKAEMLLVLLDDAGLVRRSISREDDDRLRDAIMDRKCDSMSVYSSA